MQKPMDQDRVYVHDGKLPQGKWISLRANLAESLEEKARYFYYEQYGDTPYDREMVQFASRFAACQMTGYKTEQEELDSRTVTNRPEMIAPDSNVPVRES